MPRFPAALKRDCLAPGRPTVPCFSVVLQGHGDKRGKSEIWGGSWCGKPNEISWLKKRRALTWNLKIGGLSFCRCLFLFEGSFFSGFLAVKFSRESPTWPVVPSSTFFWLVDTSEPAVLLFQTEVNWLRVTHTIHVLYLPTFGCFQW